MSVFVTVMLTLAVVAAGAVGADSEAAAAPAGDAEATEEEGGLVEVELSTVGLDMRLRAPVVLLRDAGSEQVVPIWVGLPEAQAIYRALRGIPMPRPMTHDLLASTINELGAEVVEIAVHDLREGTYHGRVVLRMRDTGDRRELDSRPSDAMALALRVGAPIRVARQILDDAPPIDFVIPDDMEPVVRTLGITVVELGDAERRELELDERGGVLVSAVAGQARDEGLRSGDVILSVNGRSVSDPVGFFEAAQQAMAQGRVTMEVWRDDERFDVELDIDAPPPPPGPAEERERMEI